MNAFRIMIVAVLMMTASPSAQWLNYPTPGIPRTPDGKPNLSAPAPKTADGKPDLSGLWLTRGIYIGNIARDLKPGEVPIQPWAEELYKQRRDTLSKDDPTGRCIPGGVPRSTAVPYPFKILTTHHEHRRRPLRSGACLSADLHRWPAAAEGSESQLDGLLGRPLGRRHVRRRVRRLQRQRLAGQRRPPAGESLRVTERFRRKDFGTWTSRSPSTIRRPTPNRGM